MRAEEIVPMNARHLRAVVAAAVAAAGCAAKPSHDLLPGAVYAASVVKVYRNAELTHVLGNESWGDGHDSYTQGQTWYFSTEDGQAKVLAFYEKLLPGAERTTNDDGSVTFRIVPEGAEKNEDVQVTVADGEIRIGEHCRPGKIKG
jgi:hypothetical protein